jgi:S-DNA-T family DNA segregation ATPase FtsK/SpoIIIE
VRSFLEEVAGLLLVAFALLAALALFSYSPGDPAFRLVPVENSAGVLGASVASLLVGGLGWGGWIVAFATLLLGARLLFGQGLPRFSSRFWVSGFLLLVAVSTLPALLEAIAPGSGAFGPAGALGFALAGAEERILSATGALLVNTVVLVFAAVGVFGVAPSSAAAVAARAGGATARGAARAGEATARTASRATSGLVRAAQDGWCRVRESLAGGVSAASVLRERRARRARVRDQEEIFHAGAAPEAVPSIASEPEASETGAPAAAIRSRSGDPAIVDHRDEVAEESASQAEFRFQTKQPTGPYKLPDLDIFQRAPEAQRSFDRDSLIMNSRILEKKLQDYGVRGRVVTVHPGPVITMYEFEPASGIKVNRIVNLADDLALALRALSVRIIAPIPGKSVVGIEVPNPDREVVYLRDLLESQRSGGDSKLAVPLGKDIFGNAVEGDLARMPHLMVAGATGTGKSVFLNSLLCGILCRATPDEVKLLLIDPKLLELSVYEDIPHLIADVVTNPKRAAAALAGIVHKMEERYQMMAAVGVRNIAQFNERVEKELAAGNTHFRLRPKPGESEGAEVAYERLCYIVVVIDELADLMVVAARDVEESLQRLAQMARASGIHLVLATQRPSVDVITGVIKANFPSRISFQVSSGHDSRTILDHKGAEHLLGQGDMLFLAPGTSKLQRLHGPFVTEDEVTKLATFLREQGQPRFDETLMRLREESEAKEVRGEDVDELYDRALEIVAESRNASISYIQRRLKVGYNRAARMIEQMEIEGVVGPQEGVKPREIFVRPIGEDYE